MSPVEDQGPGQAVEPHHAFDRVRCCRQDVAKRQRERSIGQFFAGENATTGYFTTVWQRQKDGKYKWVSDMGEPLPMALDAPEMIMAKVADCPPGYRGKPPKQVAKVPAQVDPAQRGGTSLDGTLTWATTVAPDLSRRFTVTIASGGTPVTVQDLQVEAPAK